MSKKIHKLVNMRRADLDEFCKSIANHYSVATFANGDTSRTLEIPDETLKNLQRKLLRRFYYAFPVSESAHAYVPGRSIISHARNHVGKELVVTLDFRQFFHSIHDRHVEAFLYTTGLSTVSIDQAMALTTYADALPVGAPTSPYVSNLVLLGVDWLLGRFARSAGWSYSRYADDLAFSGNGSPGGLLDFVNAVVSRRGFALAPEKTRIMKRSQRQLVTGLVVNDKLSIPRPLRQRLRAVLHDPNRIDADERWARRFVYHLRWVDPARYQALEERGLV